MFRGNSALRPEGIRMDMWQEKLFTAGDAET
jgi:hypothetical protein